jgi:choice-of-anchor B domain-containing protein
MGGYSTSPPRPTSTNMNRFVLPTTRRFPATVIGLGLLTSLVIAHEDDPKILHRKPPVPGSGFQRGLPAGYTLPGGGTNTQAAGTFDAQGVILRSWLTMADLGSPTFNGSSCWGYTSPSGREYAVMCTTNDTVFVEITNPDLPVIVQRIDGPNSTWRETKVYQDRCYVVSEGGSGIQVMNMSNIDGGVVTLEGSITTGGVASTHCIAVDEVSGFAYRCGGGSNIGLRIYDLTNPGAPVYVAQWVDRYVHDAQVVTYTSGPFAGRQIAFCCSGLNNGGTDTGFTVIDVTNKSNLVVLAQLPYPARAYSHQGWLTEDRTIFYLGDELDENGSFGTRTHMFNVADLNNVAYIGAFEGPNTAIGHNMYTKNGILYQANYTSGLRMFDVASNPTNPPEIGYFDTSSLTGATFNGLWSCFPYFPSGTVIGSDIEGGLFVMTVDFAQIDVQIVGGPPSILDPAGDSVDVTIVPAAPGDLVAGSETLWYDDGTGFTSSPLTNNGNNLYTATFPAIACGTNLRWYVAASSPAGSTFAAPASGASGPYETLVAVGATVARFDPMDAALGWVGGQPGDTATSGQWVRGNPVGTSAQPEDDHTPVGTDCWFTGQGTVGGQVGAADVDNGFTTLITPVIDMSSLSDPQLSYWRWYSNDQGGAANSDTFNVSISNDGGTTWTTLEVVGPAGAGTAGGWIEASFDVASVITPTAQMRVRFVASDLGTGSIVEAAIDDFTVGEVDCGGGIGQSYCQANVNVSGFAAYIDATGSNVLANNDLVLTAHDVSPNANGYFITAQSSAFVPNPGGSAGNLCVGSPAGRYISQLANSGPLGVLTLVVDVTSMPLPNGNVAAQVGESWYFQTWFRDSLAGLATSNFSRGFAVTFQ